MLKHTIKAEIETLLETIQEQNDLIQNRQGVIPQIELDILLGNISKLYEQFLLLKKGNQTERMDRPIVEMIVPKIESNPVVKQEPYQLKEESTPALISYGKEKTNLVSFVVRPSFVAEAGNEVNAMEREPAEVQPEMDPIHLKLNNPFPPVNEKTVVNVDEGAGLSESMATLEIKSEEDQKEPVIKIVPEKKVIIPEKDPEPLTKRSAPQSIGGLFDTVSSVADKFEGQTTLHDKISRNKTDSSLGKKLQNKPVDDLKKSIGINEKFSFINELFEGDLNNYNKAIEALNQFGTLEDALKLINEELSPKYNWNPNGKSVKGLTELLERKYIK